MPGSYSTTEPGNTVDIHFVKLKRYLGCFVCLLISFFSFAVLVFLISFSYDYACVSGMYLWVHVQVVSLSMCMEAKKDQGIWFLGAGVTGICGMPDLHGCWDPNSVFPIAHQVLLTAMFPL